MEYDVAVALMAAGLFVSAIGNWMQYQERQELKADVKESKFMYNRVVIERDKLKRKYKKFVKGKKFSTNQIIAAKRMRESGSTYKEIGKRFGVCTSTAYNAVNGVNFYA